MALCTNIEGPLYDYHCTFTTDPWHCPPLSVQIEMTPCSVDLMERDCSFGVPVAICHNSPPSTIHTLAHSRGPNLKLLGHLCTIVWKKHIWKLEEKKFYSIEGISHDGKVTTIAESKSK